MFEFSSSTLVPAITWGQGQHSWMYQNYQTPVPVPRSVDDWIMNRWSCLLFKEKYADSVHVDSLQANENP